MQVVNGVYEPESIYTTTHLSFMNHANTMAKFLNPTAQLLYFDLDEIISLVDLHDLLQIWYFFQLPMCFASSTCTRDIFSSCFST